MAKKTVQRAIPQMEYIINDDSDFSTGVKLISFVDAPAIEINAIAFNSQEDKFAFKSNKDKQILAGPAAVPNKMIFRKDFEEDEVGYYVFFSEQSVRNMAAKFMRANNNHSFNDMHTDKMVDSSLIGSWCIDNVTYDKARHYGFTGLPVGTWMIEVKVDDSKYWDEIKNGKNAFSIQGTMQEIRCNMDKILFSSFRTQRLIELLNEEELKELTEYTVGLTGR